MSRVSNREATDYGISLIRYFMGVILAGGGLIMAGELIGWGSSTDEMLTLGLIVSILGCLLLVAGFYGAFYKVIADGVQRGQMVKISKSNLTVIDSTPSEIARKPDLDD